MGVDAIGWKIGFLAQECLDDHWYQNIFIGGDEQGVHYGTDGSNGASQSLAEYQQKLTTYTEDYLAAYRAFIQPVYIHRNVYMRGAKAWEHESDAAFFPAHDPCFRVTYGEATPVLHIALPDGMENTENCPITTAILGSPRISEACYEAPDGSAITIDRDLLGNALPDKPLAGPIQTLHSGENRVALGHYGVTSSSCVMDAQGKCHFSGGMMSK